MKLTPRQSSIEDISAALGGESGGSGICTGEIRYPLRTEDRVAGISRCAAGAAFVPGKWRMAWPFSILTYLVVGAPCVGFTRGVLDFAFLFLSSFERGG